MNTADALMYLLLLASSSCSETSTQACPSSLPPSSPHPPPFRSFAINKPPSPCSSISITIPNGFTAAVTIRFQFYCFVTWRLHFVDTDEIEIDGSDRHRGQGRGAGRAEGHAGGREEEARAHVSMYTTLPMSSQRHSLLLTSSFPPQSKST